MLHGRPGVYTATRAGLDWARLELPVANVDLATYVHDVEAIWLGIELEREFTAEAVLTERELRSRDMSDAWTAYRNGQPLEPRYAVAPHSQTAPRGLHFPDLVVQGGGPSGGLLAVELERTSKGATRRRKIVAAYRDGLHVEQVRYYAPPEPMRALERTIADERANKIAPVFELRAWRPRSQALAIVPWLLAATQRGGASVDRGEPVLLQ
ncbi:MAG: hypothetical protein ACRDL0_02550, partial [Thermoleophilaceae bacterium]